MPAEVVHRLRQRQLQRGVARRARQLALVAAPGLGEIAGGLVELVRLTVDVAEDAEVLGQGALDAGLVGGGAAQADLPRLQVAADRRVVLDQVRVGRVALQVADLLVGRGQLQLQRAIAGRFPRQAVEVFDPAPHQQIAGAGRAGQLLDARAELEEQRVREPADVLEAPRRAIALLAGDRALPQRDAEAADHGAHRQRGGDDRAGVAADELGAAIAPGLRVGGDRAPIEVALDVVGERRHRRIAPLRLAAQRHQDDVVEIAFQRGARYGGSAPAPAAPRARRGQHQAGTLGRGGVERAEHVGDGAVAEVERLAAGEQLVEDHAERVGVAGGRDRLAVHLLGRGVGRREGAKRRARQVAAAVDGRVQDLGQSEVDQLRLGVGRHQDVRRLQVAVHDQLGVGVRRRRRRPCRKISRRAPDVEPFAGGEVEERFARHVLHDEVRLARLVDTAVEEARDVRVLERRQHLPLDAEAPLQIGVGDGAPDDLDRDLLLELAVDALGEVDRAHPAPPELAQDPVGAEARAEVGIDDDLEGGGRLLGGGRPERSVLAGEGEQRLDFAPQGPVVAAGAIQQGGALGQRHIQRLVEQRLDPTPVVGLHRWRSPRHRLSMISSTGVRTRWRSVPRKEAYRRLTPPARPGDASGTRAIAAQAIRCQSCSASVPRCASTALAASRQRSSRCHGATSCTPVGRPSARGVGTTAEGRPSRFIVALGA